ncbi:MAG: hypothetical protein LBN18_05655 [Dysgonamonadaceae bacterium]|jgi:hypothetical protein|nr:hypothetical protein [Dysgonamonadaceae bacterium]
MQIALNQESKQSIEKVTGLSYDQIISMEIETIENAIEKKIGKRLKFRNKKDSRLPSRGSAYLALNRFFDFNRKKMDRFIDSLSVD